MAYVFVPIVFVPTLFVPTLFVPTLFVFIIILYYTKNCIKIFFRYFISCFTISSCYWPSLCWRCDFPLCRSLLFDSNTVSFCHVALPPSEIVMSSFSLISGTICPSAPSEICASSPLSNYSSDFIFLFLFHSHSIYISSAYSLPIKTRLPLNPVRM